MRCIFCKSVDNSFTSVEHILPQSIGNIEHTLPKGIVCDKCNNYFSRKVENKFINSNIIVDIRHKMQIQNKKGKVPQSFDNKTMSLPEQREVARFLAKVALEALTKTALTHNVTNWHQEIIDKEELDDLRNFARFDIGKEQWNFYHRTLHPVNAIFFDKEYYELLHEYDLLYTDKKELYFITSIFGVEFTINMGGHTIGGYKEWLKSNNYVSPLYTGKNS